MAPAANAPWALAQCWFRNLSGTTAFGENPTPTDCGKTASGETSLDYSLQLAVGVRNQAIAEAARRVGPGAFLARNRPSPERPAIINGVQTYPISRDESDTGEGR